MTTTGVTSTSTDRVHRALRRPRGGEGSAGSDILISLPEDGINSSTIEICLIVIHGSAQHWPNRMSYLSKVSLYEAYRRLRVRRGRDLAARDLRVRRRRPDGDYFARRRPLGELTPVLADRLERVVLVHKLREVTAQLGFTRFEAIMPDIDGTLSLGVKPAALSREPTWVPAIENRGEGIYLGFSQAAIEAWQKRAAVQARGSAAPAACRNRSTSTSPT